MGKWDLITEIVPKIKAVGCRYEVNMPVSVSHRVTGYKKVFVDVAILDKDGNLSRALFIGPPKERRMLKYQMLKVPVYYFHDKDIEPELERFIKEYTQALFL